MKVSKPETEQWLGKYPAGSEKDNTFLGYQKREYELAISKTTNRRLALDIGAHIGIMSYRLVSDFTMVHAFEPLFHTHLKYNVQSENLVIHPFAVGDKKTQLNMRVGIGMSGGSNVTERFQDSKTYKQVDSVTIDLHNFSDVDFIKIDVEKYEYNVLIGCKDTIQRNKPVMLIEVDKENELEVFNFLENLNYTYEKVSNKDYVCVSSSLS